MLAIILTILKIIGITILVILGLVLFLLAIILFVPIRYKGDGILNDAVKEAHLKVTWLLHAVHVQVNYSHPGNPETIIKVLGINIEKFKKKKKQEQEKDIDSDKVSKTEASDTMIQTQDQSTASEIPEEEPVSENIRNMVEQAQALQKETWRDKLNKIINKITSVYDKVRDVILNIQYYLNILQEEDTQAVLHVTLDALLDILKKLRPRKLAANIKIGFDTPDTTGKLYGVYWMFKPALGEHVVLEPVFEEKVMEGDIFFKGQITVFTVLINVLKVVLDKRFMPLINKFKNGGTKNGGKK